MVDVTHDEAIRRFPWTYSKVRDKQGNLLGFRVRLDFIIVSRPDDPYSFDMCHFNSLSDRLDNAQLARDCDLDVDFGSTHIFVTPRTFSCIYHQILDHESLCASLQST